MKARTTNARQDQARHGSPQADDNFGFPGTVVSCTPVIMSDGRRGKKALAAKPPRPTTR
jgi:hypothetical protein